MTHQPTVLHVLEALEGGTSRHITDLVRHAHGVRHVVAVPSQRIGGITDQLAVAAMTHAGAEVHLVEMRRAPLHPRNVKSLVDLVLITRDVRPDVVHAHSSIAGVLARVMPLAGDVARVYTPHALAQSRIALTVERRLSHRTDQVVAVSESESALLQQLGVATTSQLVTIPNGVDTEALNAPGQTSLRQLAGFAADVELVGSLGRLLPQKAPERFMECIRVVARARSETRFIWIGDGPLASVVDSLAACPELDSRFVRLPEVQGAAPLLSQLDVFMLLSRFEGAPYSPLEAMAGGTPAVLSDVVGNTDVLTDGGLAELLVPDGDPTRAADIVLQLLENPDLAQGLAARARSHVQQRFEVRQMGQAYTALYQRLAKPRP
jgi:glycosyltransferase involved in cell wall biosynthesis